MRSFPAFLFFDSGIKTSGGLAKMEDDIFDPFEDMEEDEESLGI
jgi:hypothetical protein